MMSSLVAVVSVGAIVGLLLLSAFFSSSEIAIFSLQPEWIDQQAATNDREARTLQELRANPHRLLVTLLIGNNIVNIAISSIVTALLVGYIPAGTAVVVTTLVASVVVLIFGEIVPKAFGLGHADSWSLTVAGPIRFVERVLSPVITLLEVLTARLNTVLGLDPEIEKPYLE